MRIGMGYDVHRYAENRKFILGGEEIEFEKGLLGHSDADVLLHALMDAMLGALALGDIGKHFPDTDPEYSGISSMKLLKYVDKLIKENGYEISNADCIVVAERPKLAPHIDKMRQNIADAVNTDVKNISVKATTEEKLGFTGTLEGVKAYAVCILKERTDLQ